MPELPEVETVAEHLRWLVTGKKILSAMLYRERLAPETPPERFAELLRNSVIDSITRRGKHILINLAGGRTLIVHLRMSGRFMLLPVERELPKFAHAVFELENETRLVFEDQRHFGMMKIIETAELAAAKEIAKLAPEPFSDEFTPDYLYEKLKRSGRNLKEFLLDQTKVCGLGNIYANEAMFLTRINPNRIANTVSKKTSVELHSNIRAVLTEALALAATIPVNSEDIGNGIYGEFNEWEWRVYGREGEQCPNCKTPILRIKQGGRSTFYCSKCQRK